MSCPVADAAVSSPTTRPRRRTNQRICDCRREDDSPSSRPRGRRRSPRGVKLPGHGHQRRQGSAGCNETRAPATTGRIPQRSIIAAANGPTNPNENEIDRDRKRDGRPRPAELRLQRHHQYRRRGPDTRAASRVMKVDRKNDPRVMDAGETGRNASVHRTQLLWDLVLGVARLRLATVPNQAFQKTIDPLECLFDLIHAGGVGAADVPRAAGSKGIARNDGNPRLIQQPGREVVRGEPGRDDRGERVERTRRKVTVQSEAVQPETIACRRSA